jgi:hypothetical protein
MYKWMFCDGLFSSITISSSSTSTSSTDSSSGSDGSLILVGRKL